MSTKQHLRVRYIGLDVAPRNDRGGDCRRGRYAEQLRHERERSGCRA
jgi:hypothetical protein